MKRKQDGLVPIGEVFGDLGGPVKEIREATPQSLHHFTRFDQVNQLVGASEADPDLGFMARTMALCSLPRSNPGNRHQYKRVNGPYKLVMVAGADNKLPYGSLPRLLLAWVSTEAVRTQSRELVLGRSLSDFMRTLGIGSDSGGSRGELTRLRNQMRRLFNAHVQLVYEDKMGEASGQNGIAPGRTIGPRQGRLHRARRKVRAGGVRVARARGYVSRMPVLVGRTAGRGLGGV